MKKRAPNFGVTQEDYLAYRPAFASQLYERLRAYGIGKSGQKLLDLGAGTGLFSEPLRDVYTVTAVDVSIELLRHAAGHRVAAAAEKLAFASGSFDAVVAAQCWHWFDRTAAPAEIFRVLKPGGILGVVYQTYIPLPESIAYKTEQVILQHQPAWRHANSTGVNGQVLRDIQAAGFAEIESFSFDVEIEFTRDSWSGYIRSTSAVGASMPPSTLARFEADHLAMLKSMPEKFPIPHRIFAVVTKRPASL